MLNCILCIIHRRREKLYKRCQTSSQYNENNLAYLHLHDTSIERYYLTFIPRRKPARSQFKYPTKKVIFEFSVRCCPRATIRLIIINKALA